METPEKAIEARPTGHPNAPVGNGISAEFAASRRVRVPMFLDSDG